MTALVNVKRLNAIEAKSSGGEFMRNESTPGSEDDGCIDYEGIEIIVGSMIVDAIYRVASRPVT